MTRAQMIKALTPLVVACLAVLVVYWPGSKPAGLPSEQNTRLSLAA